MQTIKRKNKALRLQADKNAEGMLSLKRVNRKLHGTEAALSQNLDALFALFMLQIPKRSMFFGKFNETAASNHRF